jgi:hypothetical protein
MKVIARDKDSGWYFVSVPEHPKKSLQDPTYYGNGEKGVMQSLSNIMRMFTGDDADIEDLRSKNVPVPDKIRTHIESWLKRDPNKKTDEMK